jgi:cysteine desulfurase/selenocysteine lyase
MEAGARCADRLDITYQAATRLLGRTPQQVAFGAVPRVRLFDLGKEKPACVTFTLDGWSCSAVKQNLADRGTTIATSGRAYTPFDVEMRGIAELLRASVHLSTTEHDIEKLMCAVRTFAAVTCDDKGIVN